jgi:hypothetical protein
MPPNSGITEPELANGEPPDYDRDMDRRLIVLETRFDTILPTLATKADLVGLKAELKADIIELGADMRSSHADLRAEMRTSDANLRTEMHKWMAATLISLFVGFGGMLFAMLTLLRPA